jgi:hypothetical protein
MVALALCLAAAVPACDDALAQQAAPAPDPAFEAAKTAFEALPEKDRRAIQDGLIWTGDYKGTVDGNFGRGTRAAIAAYAQRTGLPADGTLDQRGRSMLAAAAAQARNAVGFTPVRDPKTGVAVGLPTKLLPRRTDTAQGSRWASGDGTFIFETSLYPPAGGDLPALFDRLKTSTPQRKVTYRLLRPDFLVVSGEIGKSIFYTRIAAPPPDRPSPLRGYTLTYPNGNKALDNISIAVANGWAPFPEAAAANVASGPGSAPASNATPPTRPAGPSLAATALAVAPDKVVSALGTCTDPRVAGRPATVLKRDEATGLTLLQVTGLNARPVTVATGSGAGGDAVMAVFLQRKGSGTEAEPAVAPGEILSSTSGGQGDRVLAPLQAEGQGAPVLSRAGVLIGLAGRLQTPRRVAGVVPQQAWPLISPAALTTLVGAGSALHPQENSGAAAERTAANLAQSVRSNLYPVLCTP